MRKLKYILAYIILFLPLLVTQVHATAPVVPSPVPYDSLEDIINTLSQLVVPVVIVTLIGVLMYAGWIRITSQGDADKIAQSTKIITAALAGFAIMVLAPTIVQLVGGLLGVRGGLIDFTPGGN